MESDTVSTTRRTNSLASGTLQVTGLFTRASAPNPHVTEEPSSSATKMIRPYTLPARRGHHVREVPGVENNLHTFPTDTGATLVLRRTRSADDTVEWSH